MRKERRGGAAGQEWIGGGRGEENGEKGKGEGWVAGEKG